MTTITNEEAQKILLEKEKKYEGNISILVDNLVSLLSDEIRENLQVMKKTTSREFSSKNDRKLFFIEERPHYEKEGRLFQKVIEATSRVFNKNGLSVNLYINIAGDNYDGTISITSKNDK